MSNIDKRIKVNTIIENQLPEFLVTDFPKAVEFLKQYYISQEFQGGPSDLITNFDQYLKSDNLVPEVIVGVTSTSAAISTTDTTITVPSTKGFPSEYGLLKIDDEIISYTGITSTTFTGCIRGFSGITGFNVGVSSSVIVNIPVESLIVAFVALDRVMVTVSFGSSVESARTVIGIVPVVAPALIVNVPFVAV